MSNGIAHRIATMLLLSAMSATGPAFAGGLCPADVNNSNSVDVGDLLAVITAWGTCPAPCPPNCPADVNHDCSVNVGDLLAVITSWGPCACIDVYEPNENCNAARTLSTVGSDQTVSYSSMNLSAAGDIDYFVFPCHETDSSCACGFPFTDEDYIVRVTLTVPAGASAAYEICLNVNSCGFPAGYCFTVQPGQSGTFQMNVDGQCGPGTTDDYSVYVRIAHVGGGGGGAADCATYSLSCNFDAGYCF